MSNVINTRCCVRCGRWGTRGWTTAPTDGEGKTFVCSNESACKRRADARGYGQLDEQVEAAMTRAADRRAARQARANHPAGRGRHSDDGTIHADVALLWTLFLGATAAIFIGGHAIGDLRGVTVAYLSLLTGWGLTMLAIRHHYRRLARRDQQPSGTGWQPDLPWATDYYSSTDPATGAEKTRRRPRGDDGGADLSMCIFGALFALASAVVVITAPLAPRPTAENILAAYLLAATVTAVLITLDLPGIPQRRRQRRAHQAAVARLAATLERTGHEKAEADRARDARRTAAAKAARENASAHRNLRTRRDPNHTPPGRHPELRDHP